MKKVSALILAALVSLSVAGCSKTATTADSKAVTNAAGETTATVAQMKGEDLNKIMEDAKEKEKYTVLDVRSKDEYEAGHVKYAINESVDTIEKNLEKYADLKDMNIVTICNTGKKSQKAADILAKNGFKKVINAQGVKDFKYTTITKVANIRGAELQKIANEGTATVIDARDLKDYEAGHLKGAISVLPAEVEAKMASIPKDKPVVVYCYSGNKSMAVAQKLSDAGYKATSSLDGTKEYKNFELVK